MILLLAAICLHMLLLQLTGKSQVICAVLKEPCNWCVDLHW